MKRQQLQWWDILILSIIFFGSAIYNSTVTYLNTSAEILSLGTEFTAADNWFSIGTILLELLLGYLYLHLRRFDFACWSYRPTWKGTMLAIGFFLLLSVTLDLVDILIYGWEEATAYVGQGGSSFLWQLVDPSLLLFSLLNGVYEEIFFLGICTVVSRKQMPWVLLYSLVVRFSFHTYQGLIPALEIGFLMGAIYLFLYRKSDRNLYPFMLSHTLGDIFGLGILTLL